MQLLQRVKSLDPQKMRDSVTDRLSLRRSLTWSGQGTDPAKKTNLGTPVNKYWKKLIPFKYSKSMPSDDELDHSAVSEKKSRRRASRRHTSPQPSSSFATAAVNPTLYPWTKPDFSLPQNLEPRRTSTLIEVSFDVETQEFIL